MEIAKDRHRYGWRAACHKLAYKLVKRCILLDVTHLMVLDISDLMPVANKRATFRSIRRDELEAFAGDRELELDPSIVERLYAGLDYCFGAFLDGRLVGYYWMAIDSIEAINNSDGSESTGVEMSFPPDVMFSYKAFVHPSYRGQGLYADLVYSACHWAHRNLGVNTLVSTTDWTNFAALRSCRRQGRKSLGLIWRFGLAGRYLTLQPSLAASYGIRVGQQAQVKARLCAAKRYWRYSLGIHTIAGFRAHAKSR